MSNSRHSIFISRQSTFKISLTAILFFSATYLSIAQIQQRDSLIEVYKTLQDGADKINSLVHLSEWYKEADFTKATSLADQAVNLAGSLGDERLWALTLTHRAMLYWENGEYKSSIQLNGQSIKLREHHGDSAGVADNFFSIAMNYYYSADYSDAIKFFTKALDSYRALGNRRQEAEALKRIGFVYHWMGDYPNAIPHLVEYSRVRNEFEGYIGRTANLGSTSPYFDNKEYYQLELEMQLSAKEELATVGDREKLLLTLLNIADTYKELGQPAEALEYHKEAVKLSRDLGRFPNLNYLGNAYRSVGKIDSAIAIHQFYLENGIGKRNAIDLMWTRFLLGQDYFQAGNFDLALRYYYDGLKITVAMGNKLDVVINLLRIADAHVANGELTVAKSRCEESLSLAKKIKVFPRLKDGYLKLSKIESQLGNYDEAYRLMERYRVVSDSLTEGEASLQLARTQVQYDLDKRIADIENLKQEAEIKQARIEKRDWMIGGFVIIILLVVLLAWSSYRRYKQKEKANEILTEQKRQIEVLLAEIHHRVKNNLQVISSLLSIQSDELKSKSARMAVLEGQSRVQAMGLIHENIYKAENFAHIKMAGYISKLTDSLLLSFGLHKQVTVSVECDPVAVDVDTAIPLGLIINELFTNSLKHAFKNIENPRINLNLKIDRNQLLLEVSDNGRGYLIKSDKDSFGLKLVRELTNQLGGSIEFAGESGFQTTVRITKFKLAA
ncbi:MAG: tetratricopeptide repeat protein [Cyclobacteriaceae bacterium]|nr:tetratricopeptide repeat protein [Cyclobacteriaceae bacterium]